MRAEESVPAIIDHLYAGTLDDAAWERALVGITNLVNGVCSCLFAFRPTDGTLLRDESYRFDRALIAQYRQHWSTKDPRLPAALSAPVGRPIFETQIMSKRSWQMTEIYNDFLVPIDVPWFFSTWLYKAPDKVVSLSVQGSRRRGPFDDRDTESLQPIIPHLRRALEIKDRLELAQVHSDSLSKSMDNLSFGMIVLDACGRILEANAVAQELLVAGIGIHRNTDGTLWLREPAGDQLGQWLLNGTPPKHNVDGLLHVPRPLATNLSVMVTRLPELPSSWTSGGPPCWMLLLFDPDRRINASVELIARDLGLTAREAEIAALLASGHEINNIASRLKISLHTARTHLKSIFSRTGIRSQAELIRRVANGPAGLRNHF